MKEERRSHSHNEGGSLKQRRSGGVFRWLTSGHFGLWRTSIYNLCILLVEVGSSGKKDGGKE